MKVKITRVMIAEIEEEDLEGLKKALKDEDMRSEEVAMETDFDDEGKIVDYTCLNQTSTVEVEPS